MRGFVGVAFLLVALLLVVGVSDVHARGVEVSVPMTVKGMFFDTTILLAATEYRPGGSGPFPAVVISHGVPWLAEDRAKVTATYVGASAAFVEMGLVVLNPVRRGFGKTGGAFEEGTGGCRFFAEAAFETAKDIAAAVTHLRRHPLVDPDRIVLVGQSGGGWGSLAAATRDDVPIRGVVNFAGGLGGKLNGVANSNCAPDRLVADTAKLGKSARVPSLWIYTENDQYFGPALSRRMYGAYTGSGAAAAFMLLPSFGEDGHSLFASTSGVPLWRERVEAFLREIGVLDPSR